MPRHRSASVSVSCTLWVHDEAFSTSHVLFDPASFTGDEFGPGAVLQVTPKTGDVDTHDFGQSKPSQVEHTIDGMPDSASTSTSPFIFVSSQMDHDFSSRHAKLQLSVSQKIADLFHFQKNSQVWLSPADPEAHTATHLEISLRDAYLTRADMRRITISCCVGRALYAGQTILYAGAFRATIAAIYLGGRKVRSALIKTTSRPIFRSESARFIIYIQMSREMWDFDRNGSGEIAFSKIIDGILPELFQRWSDLNARHLVNIVLFARIDYASLDHSDGNQCSSGQSAMPSKPSSLDFYHVVVGEISSCEWTDILYSLRKEFRCFLRDILSYRRTTGPPNSRDDYGFLAGKPSTAETGNILEAINTAAAPFSKDWVDTDLLRTGLSIVVITPGSGLFMVDEAMLRLTTDNLVKNGISIDLICLSRPLLHPAPLFGYPTSATGHYSKNPSVTDEASNLPTDAASLPLEKTADRDTRRLAFPGRKRDTIVFLVPQWLHVHFWLAQERRLLNKSTPRTSSTNGDAQTSVLDLQMSGVIESEMNSISIPSLDLALPVTTIVDKDDLHPDVDDIGRLMLIPDLLTRQRESRTSPLIENDQLLATDPSEQALTRAMDEHDAQLFATTPANGIDRSRHSSCDDSRDIWERERYNRPHRTMPQGPIDNTSANKSTNDSASCASGITSIRRPRHEVDENRNMPPDPVRKGSVAHPISENGLQLSRTTSISEAGSGVPRFDSRLLLGSFRGPKSGKVATATIFHSSQQATRTPSASEAPVSEAPHVPSHPLSEQVRVSLSRPVTAIPTARGPGPMPTSYTGDDTSNDVFTAEQNIVKERSMHIQATQEVKRAHLGQQPMDRLQPDRLRARPAARVVARPKSFTEKPPKFITGTSLPIDLAPWLKITNPLRLNDRSIHDRSWTHGWTHAFVEPTQGSNNKMKWKSLCAPAALPLTSDYIVTRQLLDQCEQRSHDIAVEEEVDSLILATARAHLLVELLAFRLSKGFQVIKNVDHTSSDPQTTAVAYDDGPLLDDGCTITLVKGNQVHILCATSTEIHVTRYQPKASSTDQSADVSAYEPVIRSTLEPDYERVSARLLLAKDDLNWSMIDNCLAGHFENFSEATGYWRARFVLIPVEIPGHLRRAHKSTVDDTDDELRIEGIQRITQLWDRLRTTSTEPPLSDSATSRKDHDPNPLALEFQTRDASAVLSAGIEDSRLLTGQSLVTSMRPFSESERYDSGKIDLKSLAVDLQSDRGIDIKDRWWYLRLHPHSFLGSDLTTWLRQNVKDINSREEAERLGRKLLDLGLFKHVRGAHSFRDGLYFYSLTTDYRNIAVRQSSRGFFSRRHEKSSTPGTPLPDPRSNAEENSPQQHAKDSPSNSPRPLRALKERCRVHLTAVIQCDLDSRRRSSRPQTIHLHYDRLCNPEACYHFRLEWLDTTGKLVEEALSSWAMIAERYGLKLVQVPVSEARSIADLNPFRTPSVIRLAIPPPEAEPDLRHVDATAPEPLPTHRSHPYQRALLKRFGFVLDQEAAVNFPEDVSVRYSYNHAPYTYSQYIHKSGLVLAQVDIDGQLLLVANRLLSTPRREFGQRRDEHQNRDIGSIFAKRASPVIHARSMSVRNPAQKGRFAPHRSPADALRPVQLADSYLPPASLQSPTSPPAHDGDEWSWPPNVTAEQLKVQISSFCADEYALMRFYDDVRQKDPKLMPSPRSTPATRPRDSPSVRGTPMLTATIPTLELPPIGGIEETLDGSSI